MDVIEELNFLSLDFGQELEVGLWIAPSRSFTSTSTSTSLVLGLQPLLIQHVYTEMIYCPSLYTTPIYLPFDASAEIMPNALPCKELLALYRMPNHRASVLTQHQGTGNVNRYQLLL